MRYVLAHRYPWTARERLWERRILRRQETARRFKAEPLNGREFGHWELFGDRRTARQRLMPRKRPNRAIERAWGDLPF